MEKSESKSKSVVNDLLAGFVSGFTCKFVEHPFDTIKVLMQVNGETMYKNSYDCFKKTVSTYKVKGLYRGIQFPLLGSIAESGLTFVSYGYFKKLLGVKDSSTMTIPQLLLSSMGSGATISFLLTPVELLKCRIQIEQSYHTSNSPRQQSTTMGIIRKVIHEDGVIGLYRGLNLTLMREIPGTCIWFLAYEIALKPFYHFGYQRNTIPLTGITLAASISGATYWSIIYPIDTIKSIVQTDSSYIQKVNGKGLVKTKQLCSYFYNVIHNLGRKGLYNGLGLTLIRAVPANAVLFIGYEYAYRFFSKVI